MRYGCSGSASPECIQTNEVTVVAIPKRFKRHWFFLSAYDFVEVCILKILLTTHNHPMVNGYFLRLT
jgi:hypothetical protein